MTWTLRDAAFMPVRFIGLGTGPLGEWNKIQNIKMLRDASCYHDENGAILYSDCYGLKEAKEAVENLYRGISCILNVNPASLSKLAEAGFIVENPGEYKVITCNMVLTKKLVSILNTKG